MIATSMIDRSLAAERPMIGPRLVDLRAEQAAERTGQTLPEIERLPFDLSALEQDGIFLNVDARNFGLLDRRLDWQALGISLPRTGDVAFRPPRCGLVPDRYRLPLLRPADRATTTRVLAQYTTTLLMLSPACIRSNALLMSASGELWRFEADDNAQWRLVPDTADPLIMLRQ